MALGYLDSQSLVNIADAIRTKTGSTATMSVADMPTAIGSTVSSAKYNALLNRRFETTSPSDEVEWGDLITLHEDTFYGCKLKPYSTFVIPSQIRTIAAGALNNLTKASGDDGTSTLIIPSTITNYYPSSMGGSAIGTIDLYATRSVPDYVFYNPAVSYLKTLKISNASGIGSYCFTRITTLTTIKILDSVQSIGDHSFENCSNLSEVYVYLTTPPALGTGCFANTNPTIYVPAAAVSAYQADASWGQFTIVAES